MIQSPDPASRVVFEARKMFVRACLCLGPRETDYRWSGGHAVTISGPESCRRTAAALVMGAWAPHS